MVGWFRSAAAAATTAVSPTGVDSLELSPKNLLSALHSTAKSLRSFDGREPYRWPPTKRIYYIPPHQYYFNTFKLWWIFASPSKF